MLTRQKMCIRDSDRTADAAVEYQGDRNAVLRSLKDLSFPQLERTVQVPGDTGRKLNREYKEKWIQKVLARAAMKVFCPAPVRALCSLARSCLLYTSRCV